MTVPLRDDRILGPLREYMAELGPEALPAVEEWVLAQQPKWARMLGPWTPTARDGAGAPVAWVRHHPTEVVRVYLAHGVWYRTFGVGHPNGHAREHDAMRIVDAAAREQGYLFDPSLPLEEPKPAPVDARLPCPACNGTGRVGTPPAPAWCGTCGGSGRTGFLAGIVHRINQQERDRASTRGAGRRAGEHSWRQVEILAEGWGRTPHTVALDRCQGCGLWRVDGRRYFAAAHRVEWVRSVWRDPELGEKRAGRCPGSQP